MRPKPLPPATPASDKLVEDHMDIAAYWGKRLARLDPTDSAAVLSDAQLGLVAASRKFDPKRHVLFRTYAQKRVQGAIKDGIRDRSGRTEGSWKRPRGPLVSLCVQIYSGETRDATLEDYLEDRRPVAHLPFERESLLRHLVGFDRTTRMIFCLYYGEDLTMGEVAKAIGISESRVSQIHGNAILALRAKMTAAK